MPSKLYGILAAARPVLFIGEAGGSTAQWLAHSGGGLAFGTGDIVGAAQAIRRLAAAPEECEALGRRGHEAYAQGHGPERAALRWRELLVAAGQA
jgi:glycosyltransferase involved in cell wall biosynthesis